MSRVSFPDGVLPPVLTRVAQWVIQRGKWDIIVENHALLKNHPSRYGETDIEPWSEGEWLNARRLWCDPFWLGPHREKSGGFTLVFPDDETAVMFRLMVC